MKSDTFNMGIVALDVNVDANAAVLHFEDGSYIEFVHTSRSNRWAKPSSESGVSENCCEAMKSFRLNGKHLQVYFEDGSAIDLPVVVNQLSWSDITGNAKGGTQ
ncbi:MAG TPA: hypothetical protein DIU35_07565 [Candidatus Latescibacteria bacterium]|nr:hypothetical protein [Candidatus Latescibacterota bacterium]|tara:strand:- start:543 stop:854 length:312 start_codon:yes stop_codon:yes gene_type:complete